LGAVIRSQRTLGEVQTSTHIAPWNPGGNGVFQPRPFALNHLIGRP
jgi:hypothetical protein